MTSHLEAPGDTGVEQLAQAYGLRMSSATVCDEPDCGDEPWIATVGERDYCTMHYEEHLVAAVRARVDEDVQRLVAVADRIANYYVDDIREHTFGDTVDALRAALEPFKAVSPAADAEHRWYEPTPGHRISRCETCGCWEDEESAERPCAVSPTTVEEGHGG